MYVCLYNFNTDDLLIIEIFQLFYDFRRKKQKQKNINS